MQPSVTLPVNMFHMLGFSREGNLVVVSLQLLKEEVDKGGEATSPEPFPLPPLTTSPWARWATALHHCSNGPLKSAYLLVHFLLTFRPLSIKKKNLCEGFLAFIFNPFRTSKVVFP